MQLYSLVRSYLGGKTPFTHAHGHNGIVSSPHIYYGKRASYELQLCVELVLMYLHHGGECEYILIMNPHYAFVLGISSNYVSDRVTKYRPQI
jgi:hypothetical protein